MQAAKERELRCSELCVCVCALQASRRRLVPTMVAPSVSASSRHGTPELAKAHPQLGMGQSTEVQQLSERLPGAMQLNAGGTGREDPFTPPAASMGTWDSRSRATGGIGPSSTSQRLESRLEEVGADRQGCQTCARPYTCIPTPLD